MLSQNKILFQEICCILCILVKFTMLEKDVVKFTFSPLSPHIIVQFRSHLSSAKIMVLMPVFYQIFFKLSQWLHCKSMNNYHSLEAICQGTLVSTHSRLFHEKFRKIILDNCVTWLREHSVLTQIFHFMWFTISSLHCLLVFKGSKLILNWSPCFAISSATLSTTS